MDAMTCGTCGRECLPDGDCYGCEADRWRAHAEALAGALEAIESERAGCHATYNGGHHNDGHLEAFHHGMDTVFNALQQHVFFALARLPVQALAERRALERVAMVSASEPHTFRGERAGTGSPAVVHGGTEHLAGDLGCELCNALAALDAARREGRA